MDYSSKYTIKEEGMQQRVMQKPLEEAAVQSGEEQRSVEDEALIKKLKAFRLEQSRKEQVKPYFIFNDKQMMALIDKRPATLEELIQISGFGEVKCQKYGEAILKIFYME